MFDYGFVYGAHLSIPPPLPFRWFLTLASSSLYLARSGKLRKPRFSPPAPTRARFCGWWDIICITITRNSVISFRYLFYTWRNAHYKSYLKDLKRLWSKKSIVCVLKPVQISTLRNVGICTGWYVQSWPALCSKRLIIRGCYFERGRQRADRIIAYWLSSAIAIPFTWRAITFDPFKIQGCWNKGAALELCSGVKNKNSNFAIEDGLCTPVHSNGPRLGRH